MSEESSRVDWTSDIPWDSLRVRIFLTEELQEEKLRDLEGMIVGWQAVGVSGGFEGKVHDVNMHGLRREGRQVMYEVILDIGSAPRLALDVFLRALNGLKEWGLPIEKVVLGWGEGE